MKRIHIERKIAHLQNLLSRHYPTHGLPPIIYIERDTEGNLIVPTNGETAGPNGERDFVAERSSGTSEALNFEPQCAELELTDIPEDEINQREEEQKLLYEKLAQIELDKLFKKKPRVKK